MRNYTIVVYILRKRGQNHLFFKLCIKKKKKRKKEEKREQKELERRETCVLTRYQDVLVFSTFEDIKIVCALTPYQDVLVFSTFEDIK